METDGADTGLVDSQRSRALRLKDGEGGVPTGTDLAFGLKYKNRTLLPTEMPLLVEFHVMAQKCFQMENGLKLEASNMVGPG